jgi:peptide/nickel transport system substrate-binding protein
MSRWPFLRFTALTVSIVLLAACSSTPSSSGPTAPSQSEGQPTGTVPPAQSYNPDASLSVVLESAPPHLDNQLTTARLGRTVTDPVNVFLVRHDKEMKLENYLATRWEEVDELTYRFYLHQGVKFHNGRELVAEDVKRSMERILDPDAGSQLRADFVNVASVTPLDNYTVEFKLTVPFAPFVEKLVRLPIIPMEVVEA